MRLFTNALLLICFLSGYYFSSCSSRIGDEDPAIPHYPEPAPDSVALTFLPDIVSTDSLDFNAAFSPDGQTFYFTRSISKKLTIYFSTFSDDQWTMPQPVSFDEPDFSFADPAFSPDGKLYFISNRPKNSNDTLPDYDIWFVEQDNGTTWSTPFNVDIINSDSNEYYVSFSRNGNLYFSSARVGGFGQEDIYVSIFRDGKYQQPVNLGPAINTEKSEYDPGILPEEDKLIFSSSNRPDSFGGADLYMSNNVDGTWRDAIHLDSTFNTESREYCSTFSSDSKYFFFVSRKDVKWIDAKYLR